MTTENQAAEAIYQRLLDNLPTGILAAQVTFDDEDYEPPEDSAWLRLTIIPQNSVQRTLGPEGSRRYDRYSLVVVQIFVPKSEGTQLSDSIVNDLRAIYEGVRFSGLVFLTSQRRRIGVDGRWYQTNLEANFYLEEVK